MATLEEIVKKLESLESKQDRTNKSLDEVVTVLKGYDGYPGLCQRHEELSKDHYALRRLVIGLVCILVGTGVLTGGSLGIIKLIGG